MWTLMSSNAPVATRPGPTMTRKISAALRQPLGCLSIRVSPLASPIRGEAYGLITTRFPLPLLAPIATATAKGLEAALKVALQTMRRTLTLDRNSCTKPLATASGAAGGAFGLADTSDRASCVDDHHAEIDCGYCTKRRRRSFRTGICTVMRSGLCTGRTCRRGRYVRKRIFRRARHAREERH